MHTEAVIYQESIHNIMVYKMHAQELGSLKELQVPNGRQQHTQGFEHYLGTKLRTMCMQTQDSKCTACTALDCSVEDGLLCWYCCQSALAACTLK